MLIPELLSAEHDTSAFGSGEAHLDAWLRSEGLAAQRKGTSRVVVLTDDTGPAQRVLAHDTPSAHVIEREELTRRLGRGMPAQLPVVLLGELAVDASRQGSGLGGQVLAEVIARAVHLAEEVGFRHRVVDALHEEAAASSEHHGLTRVPDPGALRVVLRISPTLLQL